MNEILQQNEDFRDTEHNELSEINKLNRLSKRKIKKGPVPQNEGNPRQTSQLTNHQAEHTYMEETMLREDTTSNMKLMNAKYKQAQTNSLLDI